MPSSTLRSRMPDPVLILGAARADGTPTPAVRELADALGARARDVAVIPVRGGARELARAVVRARRAIRRRAPAVLVTVSGPASVHVAGMLAGRGRPRWVAHVETAPELRLGRWGRVFDPRPRALRRADAVTAAPAAAEALHRTAGVAVAAAPADAGALADAVLATPAPAAPGGLRILMLGTLNTPHVEHLALAMRDRGHHVVVAGDVAAAYAPSVLPAAGIDVRPIELPAMPWVRRLFREMRPDVVHAHWLPAYGFLAAVMRLRPLVVMAWGSDVYRATPMQTRQSRFAIRRARVAMSDSADLVSRLVALGADPSRTHELNWGVDLERFSPPGDRAAVRRKLGLGDGPVVLSPRALAPLYNPAVIAGAFEAADVPGARLVLKHIGTGEPDLGRPLPAGARVVGHVPYERLADYYRAAEVCVSIPDSDSSPRSVWEAMACGCACVLSDLPWVHELIEHDVHALVVAPEPEAVAAAIRRLLTEPGLADRLGLAARALVERHRDQRVEMDRLSDLYRTVAEGA
jgi:glycosyltransferase involved in cell wall biosynthesis